MEILTLREIDALIQKHIFGGEVTTYNEYITDAKRIPNTLIYLTEGGFNYIPRYSEDIKDAWKVVEKFFRVDIETGNSRTEHFVILRTETGLTRSVYAKTAPLAICLAALKTQGIEVQIDANEIGNDI
ncbi:hypothetical protein [Oceanobacillus sp. J11TS1]|uniref:BC1872 family protein n=1 Tax=Oceanobacillus sp. J11TS1 TaxID=2807191 RepID=UPI001AFE390C|nr:hypothetical protein [Oceanobacillus sp. J11TS1]GIO25380.1 hypothetical protein J11TS1_39610 [Oceanobacillus sp. J11TS1]